MRRKETILIVDDIETNIDVLNEILSYRYDIMVALNGKSALELANEKLPDLILLDIMMPEMDGYEVCKKLKSNPKTSHIPVIFTTARTDEDSIERAYDVGGVDYVYKPYKAKELQARIHIHLEMSRLLRDLQRSKKQLARLASKDPLTGLFNRRYFKVYSKNIISHAKKISKPIGLIMLDIDDFKVVNDTYGHSVGDIVLVAISNMLQSLVDQKDILCRYGGEEFVVLLPNKSIEDTKELAYTIQEELVSLYIPYNDRHIPITASIGVSMVDIEHESRIESAVDRADEALYYVKENGKNDIEVKLPNE